MKNCEKYNNKLGGHMI